jgi:dihydroxy-acid dehydratase
VTDGQLSGLVNKGLVVGEVSPEAAAGGPIGLVEDGDRIVIDVERRAVDVDVPEEELAARRDRLAARAPSAERGWLAIYGRNVTPLPEGAVLTKDR